MRFAVGLLLSAAVLAVIATHTVAGQSAAWPPPPPPLPYQVATGAHPAVDLDASGSPSAISPEFLGSLRDARGAFDLLGSSANIEVFHAYNRTYALSISGLGIQLLDVTEPASPMPAGSIPGDGVESRIPGGGDRAVVFAASDHTYALVEGYSAVRIINVTNPHSPTEVTTIRNGQDNLYALRHLPPEEAEGMLADYPGARDASYFLGQLTGMEVAYAESGKTYVLLASWERSAVQIIDVTRPQSPVLAATIQDGLGGFYALAGPHDIEVFSVAGRAYAAVAAEQDRAIQIVDITDPGTPVPVTSIRDGQDGRYSLASPTGIEVLLLNGRIYAMVSDSLDGAVQIIDITSPHAPEPVPAPRDDQGGFVATGMPKATFTVSDRAYFVTAGADSVRIMDITNPRTPQQVAAIQNEYGFRYYRAYLTDVEIFEVAGRVYGMISGQDDHTKIIDITDPRTPQVLVAIRGGQPLQLHGGGGTTEMEVFAASGGMYALAPGARDQAMRVINITDPRSPVQVTTIPGGRDGFGSLGDLRDVEAFTISGETYVMMVGSLHGVVYVLNVTDPRDPAPITEIWDGAGAIETFTSQNNTYGLLSSPYAIQVINLTDPATSRTISGARTPGGFGFEYDVGVFAVDGQTYAMAPPEFGRDILIANITDPASPAFLDKVEMEHDWRIPTFTDPTDAKMFDSRGRTYALVAGYSEFEASGVFQIIDVTRFGAPVLLATIQGSQDGFAGFVAPTDVEAFVAGGRDYATVVDHGLGSGGSVQIIDITDPGDIRPAAIIQGGVYATNGPVDIAVFEAGGATYAIISNLDGSVLQTFLLAGADP